MNTRHFMTLLRLDATLAMRHRLVPVVIVVAAVFGLLVGWVFPSGMGADASTLVQSGEIGPVAHDLVVLRPGIERPPFNLTMLPVLLSVDVVLLGFMFAAVMVLQDRELGVLELYRVSPGSVVEYVGSKLVLNLGLVLLNVLVLFGLGAPQLLLCWQLYPLVLGCAAGMTLLGIGMGAYFRNLSVFF